MVKPNFGAEELSQRRVSQRSGVIVRRGQQGGSVYRNNRARVLKHIVPEPGIGRYLEKSTRPEAQLLGVHIERVIHVAPEIAVTVAAAAGDELRGHQQIDIEHRTTGSRRRRAAPALTVSLTKHYRPPASIHDRLVRAPARGVEVRWISGLAIGADKRPGATRSAEKCRLHPPWVDGWHSPRVEFIPELRPGAPLRHR
jgi:hypothetical protein